MKKVIAGVIIVILCILVGMTIYYMQPVTSTIRTEEQTIEVTAEGSAVFVRDEKVYTADFDGTVFNHFSDGDRVEKGATIQTLFRGSVKDEYLAELSMIVRKIYQASKGSSYNYSNETQVEKKLDEYRSNIREYTKLKDVASVREIHQKIDNIRNGAVSDSVNDEVDILRADYDAVIGNIGKQHNDISSETSGVYTTVLDGLEDILTYDNATQITLDEFERIKNIQGTKVGRTVNQGDQICKVVNNHEWYVLTRLENSKIKDVKTLTHATLRFDNIPGEETDGRIESIIDNGDGTSLVLFKSTHYIEGAFSYRTSNVTVVFESYTGYVVPENAVYNGDDESKYVYAINEGDVNKYPVKIIYDKLNDGTVVVATPDEATRRLESSDEICTSLPKGVSN